MSNETISFIQALMYTGLTVFMVLMLYGYIWHLYSSQKSGRRDYEKYSKLALDDDLTSEPLEAKK